MKGAFQGVITTAGPAGMRSTRLRVPFELQVALLVAGRELGVGAVVARAARDHARAAATRAASPCPRTRPRRSGRRSRRSGRRAARRWTAPAGGPSAAQAGKASPAARHREVGARRPRARPRRGAASRSASGRRSAPGARHALAADVVVDRDVGTRDAHARVLGREHCHQRSALRSPSFDGRRPSSRA